MRRIGGIWAVVCLVGCVRMGLDLPDMAADPAPEDMSRGDANSADATHTDSPPSQEADPAGTYALTVKNDDCAQAGPVLLAPGTTLIIDTSKATNNFNLPWGADPGAGLSAGCAPDLVWSRAGSS